MKTSLYFYLIIVLSLTVQQRLVAQPLNSSNPAIAFSKGFKQLTVSYGYGQGNIAQNRSVTQILAGYYIANQLLIGVTGSMTREWLDQFNTGSKFSAGPVVRYQFTTRRLSPFIQLAYQIGTPIIAPTHQALGFTPGVNLAVWNQIRVEASYGLLFGSAKDWVGQPQLGATILVGNRHSKMIL